MQGIHGAKDGHTVVFVNDEELPGGVNWALVEFDGEMHCIVKRSCVTEDVLEEAWGGYRYWGRWLSMHSAPHTPVPGCCPLAGHEQARAG